MYQSSSVSTVESVYQKKQANDFIKYTQRKLMRFFVRHTQNVTDAEDLTQNVFYKALKRNEVLEEGFPDVFLYTLAWNVLRDNQRRSLVRKRDMHVSAKDIEMDTIACNGVTPENNAIEAEQCRYFGMILRKLPSKQQEVFLLSRYYGLTYKQISDRYGFSTSAVEKHMMKALKHFKGSL